MIDLTKAIYTLSHHLVIAKLSAYGFQHDALKLIYTYLADRLYRRKINSAFCSREELTQGILQGSVFFPRLFNIYLNDLFYLPECAEA